jgi:hypothetical protein
MRLFLDSGLAASGKLRLRLAGHVDPAGLESLKHTADVLGLQENLEIRGKVNRAQALNLLTRSQLAVVLAQSQEYQVPAKLYESVALGKPTLVLAEPHSAARTEAERVGAFGVNPDDFVSVCGIMEQAIRGDLTITPIPPFIDYGYIAKQLGDVLADVIDRKQVERQVDLKHPGAGNRC